MGIPLFYSADLSHCPIPDIIIDAVFGYSLKGEPEGSAAEMIDWANGQSVPVLSLDIPSGIEGSSGIVKEPAIRAHSTMTLALPKKGMFSKSAQSLVGLLYLADISVPPVLYEHAFDLKVGPLFSESPIIEIR